MGYPRSGADVRLTRSVPKAAAARAYDE
jgi:hypothetical protein